MKYAGYRTTLLAALGCSPTPARMRFLEAWADCEGGMARFNAFNTTLRLPGSVPVNRAGVQHYLDALQGDAATLLTLRLSFYEDIRRALQADGLTALQIVQRCKHGLQIWGTGSDCIERSLS